MRLMTMLLLGAALTGATAAMPSDIAEEMARDPSAFPAYACAGAKSFHLAFTAGGSALVRLDTSETLSLMPANPDAGPEENERFEGEGWTLVINGMAAQINKDGKPAYEACETKPQTGSPR